MFATYFLALVVFENPAAGQAMVEHGLAAGAAATSAAPAGGLKDSNGGMVNSLDKTLKSAQDQTDSKEQSSGFIGPVALPKLKPQTAALTPPAQAPLGSVVPPVPPRPNYEDPATIQAGTGYEELLRRFGPPAIEFTDGPNRKTMSYLSKGAAIQVEFQGGTVTSVEKPNF
jgi:hypothetical protein